MFQKVNTRVYISQHIFVMKQLCICYYFLIVFLMLMLYFSSFSGHIYSHGIIKV